MDEEVSEHTMNGDQQTVEELYIQLGDRFFRPTTPAAWAFLVTEVAEVGDILLRQGYFGEFVRANDKECSHKRLEEELGDTMLMLCVLANLVGVNLTDALHGTTDKLLRRIGS